MFFDITGSSTFSINWVSHFVSYFCNKCGLKFSSLSDLVCHICSGEVDSNGKKAIEEKAASSAD